MKRLSERLENIIDMIRPAEVLVDIGCDHGFVCIRAISEGRCRRAVAADVAEGPLEIARRNIASVGLSDRIECVLSDGFRGLEPRMWGGCGEGSEAADLNGSGELPVAEDLSRTDKAPLSADLRGCGEEPGVADLNWSGGMQGSETRPVHDKAQGLRPDIQSGQDPVPGKGSADRHGSAASVEDAAYLSESISSTALLPVCVVITGMGGRLIGKILKGAEEKGIRLELFAELIIGAQSEAGFLRHYLLDELGVCIREERCVLDDGRYYMLMDVVPGAGKGSVSGDVPGAVQGAVPGGVQGSVSGGVPGAMSGAVPGVASGDVLGAVQGVASGAVPSAVQGAVPGAGSGAVSGPIPGASSGDRPEPGKGSTVTSIDVVGGRPGMYSEAEYLYGKYIRPADMRVYMDYLETLKGRFGSALEAVRVAATDSTGSLARIKELEYELGLIEGRLADVR